MLHIRLSDYRAVNYKAVGLVIGSCVNDGINNLVIVLISISLQQCSQHGGACETNMDGYYIESVVLIALGFLWYIWRYKKVKELDRLNVSAWKCS